MDMNNPKMPMPAGPRINANIFVRTTPRTIVIAEDPPIRADDLRICPYELRFMARASADACDVGQLVAVELMQYLTTIRQLQINSDGPQPVDARGTNTVPDTRCAARLVVSPSTQNGHSRALPHPRGCKSVGKYFHPSCFVRQRIHYECGAPRLASDPV